MRQKSGPTETAEQHVRDIRRATRKKYSAEEKIRIVLAGLRGEYSISECPSSEYLRHGGVFRNGGSGSSGVQFKQQI